MKRQTQNRHHVDCRIQRTFSDVWEASQLFTEKSAATSVNNPAKHSVGRLSLCFEQICASEKMAEYNASLSGRLGVGVKRRVSRHW